MLINDFYCCRMSFFMKVLFSYEICKTCKFEHVQCDDENKVGISNSQFAIYVIYDLNTSTRIDSPHMKIDMYLLDHEATRKFHSISFLACASGYFIDTSGYYVELRNGIYIELLGTRKVKE